MTFSSLYFSFSSLYFFIQAVFRGNFCLTSDRMVQAKTEVFGRNFCAFGFLRMLK